MALLAAAKLAVLLSMEFRMPALPSPSLAGGKARVVASAAPAAQLPALSISPAVAAPASATPTAVEAVRAAILDDSKAHAAQDAAAAPTPAAQPQAAQKEQPKQQAANESVLTIQQLKTRADDLDRKEQALNTLEADLNARLAKLNELETTLKGMLDEAKTIKEEKMRHLIDVYTNMKAKQAASVLETLDENIAVKILAGMKGRTAGEILTGVSSKKAAALSEALTKLQVGQELPNKP